MASAARLLSRRLGTLTIAVASVAEEDLNADRQQQASGVASSDGTPCAVCMQRNGIVEAQRAAYRAREESMVANAEAEASSLKAELATQRELLAAARAERLTLESQLVAADEAVAMAEAAVDAIESASATLMEEQTQQSRRLHGLPLD